MSELNGIRTPVVLLYNFDSTWTPAEVVECQQHTDRMADGLRREGHTVQLAEVRADVGSVLRRHDPRAAVVFNWCEGIDGLPNSYDLVARTLDEMGFTYTGAGPWTLAHTQDKSDFKRLLDQFGISTPRWRLFTDARRADEWTIFPAIVKPVAEHCSYGITADSVVDDVAGLRRQIDYVMGTFGAGALVEEFIAGREINASIWGNGTLEVLPLYEIDFSDIDDPRRRIVDFDSKWIPDSFQYRHTPSRCPTDLPGPVADRTRAAAMAAYRTLRCRDYGRIDIRLRDGIPYVVDVNANCDITIDGGFAKTAHVAGFDYGQMTSRIVRWAEHRKPN